MIGSTSSATPTAFKGGVFPGFQKLLSGSLAEFLTLSTYRGKVVTFSPTACEPARAAVGAPASEALPSLISDGPAAETGDGTSSGELLRQGARPGRVTRANWAGYTGGARRSVENGGGYDEYILPLQCAAGGAFYRRFCTFSRTGRK